MKTDKQSTIAARIQGLQQMTTAQLREEWRCVMGEEPRSYHRAWLWRRLAWAVQAKEFGGLSARAQERLQELLPQAEAWMPLGKQAFQGIETSLPVQQARDSRLPTPGTEIVRPYRGRNLVVRVLNHGFEFDGKRYATLTAIVKAVTGGSHQSGPRFFRLKRHQGSA